MSAPVKSQVVLPTPQAPVDIVVEASLRVPQAQGQRAGKPAGWPWHPRTSHDKLGREAMAMTGDASTSGDPDEPHTLTVQLGGDAGPLKIALPPGKLPPTAVLPALHTVADAVVMRAIAAAEARGQAISCRVGCAACCRHLVLISDVEAQALTDLVARLPAPRQERVRPRFAAARERLAQAGLAELASTAASLPPERLKALARDYFRLGIACPFLDEERCSIYDERPLVCRRMIVTSPAAFCAEPDGDRVQTLRMPMLAAATLLLTSEEDPPQPVAVPLALARAWAESDRPAVPARGADVWMRRFVRRLAETRG